MKIAIIDADLIGRKRHRFPNLVCMKLSGYHKNQGDSVMLKTDYDSLMSFDKVFIAKVFTDTPIPDGELFGNILELPNVEYGGTGFFYDKAVPLPNEIEHCKPDYHLYDEWLAEKDKGGAEFKCYKDYSIGFLTRGCFRHCSFCVNRRSSEVRKHSPLAEFLDTSRKKICLLDDNFFGYRDWKKSLQELLDANKPFHFKQGLDVRLLDEEKASSLFKARYDGDFIFAFDDIRDAPIIEGKLKLIRQHTNKNAKFYVLCGYDRRGKYDKDFWKADILGTFERIRILKKHKNTLPYIMRHENYLRSPYRGMYITIAEWCNVPQVFKKLGFREFCYSRKNCKSRGIYLEKFLRENSISENEICG
mgnify:CR=1 FL=1